MKPRRIDTVLSTLDKAMRWTGVPALVARDMAEGSSGYDRNRPLRWTPMVLILVSIGLFVSAVLWPSGLEVSLGGALIALIPALQKVGPLGRPSIDDDEREAALRKDSLLFCLALLTCLNCFGQPVFAVLSHWQHWPLGRTAIVAGAGFMLNACLFGTLPTLYASWNLGRLPND